MENSAVEKMRATVSLHYKKLPSEIETYGFLEIAKAYSYISYGSKKSTEENIEEI